MPNSYIQLFKWFLDCKGLMIFFRTIWRLIILFMWQKWLIFLSSNEFFGSVYMNSHSCSSIIYMQKSFGTVYLYWDVLPVLIIYDIYIQEIWDSVLVIPWMLIYDICKRVLGQCISTFSHSWSYLISSAEFWDSVPVISSRVLGQCTRCTVLYSHSWSSLNLQQSLGQCTRTP